LPVFVGSERQVLELKNALGCLYTRTLQAVKDKQGYLPPIFHLQLDNTSKENKNKTMIKYLAWLVTCGIFQKVYLHFLPVGCVCHRCLLPVSLTQCWSRRG
jgi:hypothetical protein